MTTDPKSDDPIDGWLINQRASGRQRRLALAVSAAYLAGLIATLPFADTELPQNNACIPIFETAVIPIDFITAVLLFSHFTIYHSRAVLILACGYLFTSLIVIPHALTLPGVFSPTGLLGAGTQTAGWLYLF